MNAFEFAFYRLVRSQMTGEERIYAMGLAERAEEGDLKAAAELLEFTNRIFFSAVSPELRRRR